MMINKRFKISAVHSVICGISLIIAGGAVAKVDTDKVSSLGTNLTALGAEVKGNASGVIPDYTGGLSSPPSCHVEGAGFCNPYADDPILFTIDQSNVEQYKDNLSLGQIALIEKYDTYKMNVYKTRRTAVYPDHVLAATKGNADTAELAAEGNGLKNFDARGFPFPIPQSAVEVIWNHVVRYRGRSLRRYSGQAAPLANGKYSMVLVEDKIAFRAYLEEDTSANDDNVLFYFKQKMLAPSRLAGNVLLVHETINQVIEPRKAWLYNSGQRRVRRAPQVSYDGTGSASDGLRTADNYDMYNGAPDRYDWKLLGKKEVYIPYNSFKLDERGLPYDDIIQAGHVNSDLVRYELHRVWALEATVKAGSRHLYDKRVFYVDEDSWQAAVVDLYDGRGNLWRVQQAYEMQFYDEQIPWMAMEVVFDLQSGRYLVTGLENNESTAYEFGVKFTRSDYKPAALRREGIR